MRVNIETLAENLGISRASFWGYRTGNRPISQKAWRKLEDAERAAGIGAEREPPAVAEEEPAVSEMDQRFARIEAALERLTAAVEALACAQKPLPTSSPALGDGRKKSA